MIETGAYGEDIGAAEEAAQQIRCDSQAPKDVEEEERDRMSTISRHASSKLISIVI